MGRGKVKSNPFSLQAVRPCASSTKTSTFPTQGKLFCFFHYVLNYSQRYIAYTVKSCGLTSELLQPLSLRSTQGQNSRFLVPAKL